MKIDRDLVPPLLARGASATFLSVLLATGIAEAIGRTTPPPGDSNMGSWGIDQIINASEAGRNISSADLAGIIDGQVAYISKYRKNIPAANIKLLPVPFNYISLLDDDNRTFSRGSVASKLRRAASGETFSAWLSMTTNLVPLRLSPREQQVVHSQLGMKITGQSACRMYREVFVSNFINPLVVKWEILEVYNSDDGKAKWSGRPTGYTLKNLQTGFELNEWNNGLHIYEDKPAAFNILLEHCDPSYSKAK